MKCEIRLVLTPESYTIAHERLFYFYIKKWFKICMFSDCTKWAMPYILVYILILRPKVTVLRLNNRPF